MEHFVTLFDALFLPQGLALHMSMERHAGCYTLWILCVDDEVHDVLSRLNLPNVRLLMLSKLETIELAAVKPTRSKGEYCWTLTPFAPRFVFEADIEVSRVTYLDADMWFRKNPASIFSEFNTSKKDVLITDHAYSPEYDQSTTSGQFCVQFMTFSRDGGEVVRKWWEERCIEWCFGRFEDGKFGDQKYLDDWPVRFKGLIHVLQDKELMQAPWNANRFPFSTSVLWHFHGARVLIQDNKLLGLWSGSYPLPDITRRYIYKVYLADLYRCINQLRTVMPIIASQSKPSFFWRLGIFVRGAWRIFWRLKFGTVINP